jgi:putative aminopeptidase FrvX
MSLDWEFADSYDTFINNIISGDTKKQAVRHYDSIEHDMIINDENAVAFILNNCNNLQIACKQLSRDKYVPCVYLSDNINFAENKEIAICIKTHVVSKEFKNLIIKSKNSSETPIIIGAHIDTFPGSPGASDDACGVAIGLDIIRQCATKNIWLALFTGEEMDRRGSKNFVEKNIKNGSIKPRIYINIDSGIEKGSGKIEITITPENLRKDMSYLFEDKYAVGSEVFSSNDSRAFYKLGIPVFWSWASSPFRSHSIYDILDNADLVQLGKMMENYASAINYLIR